MFPRTCTRLVTPLLHRPTHLRRLATLSKMLRTSPNIIITGSPAVGKTTHCEELARKTGLHHLSINDVVKKHNIGETSNDAEDPQVKIVDEDRLLDCIEDDLEEGGQIIDWHACDLFPVSLIDLVCVVRCEDTMKLYDRMKARGYGERKLQENLDCEIMQVLLEEAREAYAPEMVVELKSEDADEVESNVERVEKWIEQWRKDHGKEGEVKAESEGKKDEDDPMFLHG
ncbi:Adenylate kinase isoenzyme 6 HBR1 [Fulvia fulva]|uniref:Adenylate kinase isoenzyme 6 homolog n=1 Tax=Passalora fulva TaxID=5499 RepID=A0A9Q8UQM1_PASFU|nr:Adenylate kinase isoenzyme 6 HBR1 [Fulvia fulva]KAK4621906.1 Adenylate kinase isoenzyme 6 HBR1 [Fulvia fulva]KAK4622743.1 Adenylate kinase isoenzyme 6 HBR1 [Fulvia fulva]UJO18878.1 Adenylate kinase isoenzyme 6 HBR1 [Fulvia fulva]WPV16566.1 Adenylate kinase isoenzyme 6 HBR1 [Fulvia fulva]WPV31390.1 Adenylate kinase isoenzyme 6 HBR1 [Fulvia fulva]